MATIARRDTADGRRYDVRWRVNGEQRKRTFRLARDAENFKRKVESDETAGLVIDPRGGETLFGAYAATWLDTRLVRGRPLTAMTRQGYAGLLRRHVLPTFRTTRLRALTPDKVRSWHAATVHAAGADAAAKAYRVLRAILNTAVVDDLIGRNPCRIKGAGLEHAAERPILDTATVLQLADAIEPRLRALVLVAGFRTLRPGELLGLQRRDVDLLHGTLRVERQAHEVTGQGRIVTVTKSDAGTRTLSLPAPIAQALSEHLEAYVGPEADAWVFTRRSGRPLRRQDLSNAWKEACAVVGLAGAHPHDLRHHAATISARDPNVTLKELMAMMGHSSPRAALIYQHATAERDRTHADYLEGVIDVAKRSEAPQVVRLRR